MKKLLLISMIIALLIPAVLVQAEPIKLKVSIDLPPFTAPAKGAAAWSKMVTEKTEDRIKAEFYHSGALADQKGIVEALRVGLADVGMVSLSSNRKSFPVHSLFDGIGSGFPDSVDGLRACADAYHDIVKKFPVFSKEMQDFKVIYMISSTGHYIFSKKKEIRVPADLKGVKIGSGGTKMEFAGMIGAVPVFDVPTTAYQNLQLGVLDASMQPLSASTSFKYFEVAKYVTDVQITQSPMPLLMSRSSWDKISPKDQQILMEAAEDAWIIQAEGLVADHKKSVKQFTDYGNTILKLTEAELALWRQKFDIMGNKWIAAHEAEGITNAEEIYNAYRLAIKKSWSGQ